MFRRLVDALHPLPAERPAPALEDGVVLYAIGDIHGRLDLLDPLLAEIRRELPSNGRTMVVTLGDYVDRQTAGPPARARRPGPALDPKGLP